MKKAGWVALRKSRPGKLSGSMQCLLERVSRKWHPFLRALDFLARRIIPMEGSRIFRLSWSWYDECEQYLFTHLTKTREEFERDVKELMRLFGDEYLAREESWASMSNWVSLVAEKLPGRGYIAVKPEECSISGGFIIRKKGKMERELVDLVGKELWDKAVRHNEAVKRGMGRGK
jgi:hypothetical protein